MTTYVTEVWKLQSTITCRRFQNLSFQEHGGRSSLSIFFTYINFMFFFTSVIYRGERDLFPKWLITQLPQCDFLHNTYHISFCGFYNRQIPCSSYIICSYMFLNNVTVDYLGILLNADSDSVCLGQCLRVCISNQLPSDAYATGPRTHSGRQRPTLHSTHVP